MRNIALAMPTEQSSSMDRRHQSSYAVNGNSNPIHAVGQCAITKTPKAGNSWWQVDLKDVYNIWDVAVTNLADCCRKLDQLRYCQIHNMSGYG